MGDRSAFFYGTLMIPQVLYRVCYGTSNPPPYLAALLRISPAILPAYNRRKVRFCDYPAVVPSPAPSSVRGTYVRGLTDVDILRLDIFEGSQYVRKKVKVMLLAEVGEEDGTGNVEGREVEAETYLWKKGEDMLEDGEWDFAEFKREKLVNWVDVDEEYKDVDEIAKVGKAEPTVVMKVDGTNTSHLEGGEVKELLKSAV